MLWRCNCVLFGPYSCKQKLTIFFSSESFLRRCCWTISSIKAGCSSYKPGQLMAVSLQQVLVHYG